ncbi:MAG TPA: CotH kinase family protein, partial [Clostridia bacterium]|nr:CotH kinase family protein [Clostridia bacterium]
PKILDLQKSQPAIVYINGNYWGIYNIRTKYDETYFKNKYNINEDDLVVLKNPSGDIGQPVDIGFAGDELSFCKLFDFIKNNDMRIEQNYRYIQTLMDVDNYIEYNILEIFCGNDDWPANNVRAWRKRTSKYESNAPYGHDGRWRWLVFDLDCGFGLFGKSYKNNTLAMATAEGSTEWRNTDQYTIMLRKLLQNDEFKTKFINRFVELLNTRYYEYTVVEKLDEFRKIYAPYIPDHINRWKLHKENIENWETEIRSMREYALRRPNAIREHICEYFGINISELK